jgi:hypothetical protein
LREIIAAEESDDDVLERERPIRQHRLRVWCRIRRYDRALAHYPRIECGVRAECHFYDSVDATRRDPADLPNSVLCRRIHDVRRTELPGPLHIVRASNCADDEGAAPGSQLSRGRSHGADGPGDQHGGTLYRPVGEDSSMSRYPGNAEACPLLEGNPIGKADCLPRRDRHILRCGAKGTIRLRTEAPHALAQTRSINANTHCVDFSRPVAVRDYARIRHG